MCGIHGAINNDVTNSIKSLLHRGPDYFEVSNCQIGNTKISLGHTRLSIVDLSSAGNQPMVSKDNNCIIVFNGEIYNHLDLRKKLPEIKFKGHSDTETILYYIAKYGIESVKDFNGIFSFAYLNKKERKFYLVRDPFGVKPMYFYNDHKQLVFSSEIKSFFDIGIKKEFNNELLATFLRLRYLPSPYTFYKNILKLEPGNILQIDIYDNLFKTSKINYHKISKVDNKITTNDALDIYEKKLVKAVNRQLMSDVPISFLLSGGVDSALLAKLISKDANYKLESYTAGYNIKSDIDEMLDAQYTAKFLNIKNKKVLLNENEFVENLEKLIDIIEEPLGSQSIFPMFYLTENIHHDNFKVALSGQGVDEPWGGYKKYRAQGFIELFQKMPFSSSLNKIADLVKNDDLRRIMRSISSNGKVNQIKESYSFFDEKMMRDLFLDKRNVDYDISEKIISEKISELDISKDNVLDIMMKLDARMNLSDDLLLYTDKISMYNSIELRVPYLDIELVNFVESLPNKMKVNYRKSKFIHKKLAEKHLPNDIVHRKKKGFYTPRKIWFQGSVGEKFLNDMKDDNGVFSTYFNINYIENMFDLHKKGRANYEKQLYLIIVLFLWMKNNFNE